MRKRVNKKNYLSSSSISSNGKTGSVGFLSVALLAIEVSRDNNNDGSKSKLDVIANKSDMDTKPPKATVPPKLDTVNTKKPKNKTIEV